MSKNKRITAKEIKQGVTAWKVTVGSVLPITFTRKPFYKKVKSQATGEILGEGWRFSYCYGQGVFGKMVLDFVSEFDSYFSDYGITTPDGETGYRKYEFETNCLFRTREAAEKFLLDSQPATMIHLERMKDMDFWDDIYDDMYEDRYDYDSEPDYQDTKTPT